MTTQLHDTGEEYTIKNDVSAASVDVGLYNDSTDALADTDDIGDITTEPSDGNYVRQTGISVQAQDVSGDWQINNPNKVTFDVTNTTGTVDAYFVVVNFQATDTSDGSATDHLLVTGDLSQSYDLSNLDTLELSANGVGFSLT